MNGFAVEIVGGPQDGAAYVVQGDARFVYVTNGKPGLFCTFDHMPEPEETYTIHRLPIQWRGTRSVVCWPRQLS